MTKIVRATIEQLDDLTNLFDGYRQFYEQSSDLESCQSFLEERLKNNEIISYIAYHDGEPAGFVNIYPTFSSVSMCAAWIFNDLFIDKKFRRHGIAQKLMDHVYDEASKASVKSLQLETAQDNKAAQSLYEKDGWEKNEFLSYCYSLRKKNE